MTSLVQIDKINYLINNGWDVIYTRFEPKLGGPVILTNEKGDVAKVFADGRVVIMDADEWIYLLIVIPKTK